MKKIVIIKNFNVLAVIIDLFMLIGLFSSLLNVMDASEFNFSWIISFGLIYILFCNLLRLTLVRKYIYVLNNQIYYYNMFGIKRKFNFQIKIDINEFYIEKKGRTFQNKRELELKKAILILLNIYSGCDLKYYKKTILKDIKCQAQNFNFK